MLVSDNYGDWSGRVHELCGNLQAKRGVCVSRRVLISALAVAGVVVIVVAAWLGLTAGFTRGTLVLAGDVHSEVHTIRAPRIAYPVPDYSVGIPKPAGSSMGGGGGAKTAAKPQASSQPTISGAIETMYVRQGDHVKACLLYTSPSPRDRTRSRMPSSA